MINEDEEDLELIPPEQLQEHTLPFADPAQVFPVQMDSSFQAIDRAADVILSGHKEGMAVVAAGDGIVSGTVIPLGSKGGDIAAAMFAAGQQQIIAEHHAALLEAGLPVDTAGRVIHDMVTPPREDSRGLVDIDSLERDAVKTISREAGKNGDVLMQKVLELRCAALACRTNGSSSWQDYQQMYLTERAKLPEERRWW